MVPLLHMQPLLLLHHTYLYLHAYRLLQHPNIDSVHDDHYPDVCALWVQIENAEIDPLLGMSYFSV